MTIDDRLADLPKHDLDPARAARVARLAHGVLDEQRRATSRPWLAGAALAWERFVTPALLAGTVVASLAWAASAAAAIYR